MEWNATLAWLSQTTLLGMSLLNWIIASGVAIFSYIVMTTAVSIIVNRLDKIKDRTVTHVDDFIVDVLGGTSKIVLAIAAFLIGFGVIEPPLRWVEQADHLWFLALSLQIGLWLNRAITITSRHRLMRSADMSHMRASATTTLLVWALRVLLWSIVLLAMLSNLGVNITAFVASLGVGGIAIALAVQNILGDLFASLAIAIDKPFEVDDFIIMGDILGSVEEVGLKTTRVRSLSGEQIILSNTELLKNTIRNYKRMDERRVEFRFGVMYGTPADRVEAIPAMVRKIIESLDKTRFDRAHFKEFGTSSLTYEVVYYVLSPDFNLYMDIQQKINLQLMRELESLGVKFALPTQTVLLSTTPSQQPASNTGPMIPQPAKNTHYFSGT
ncbi:small-conductance mechanosensitive channel [Paucimonas lemoignei]|uniref:Small-conductance mechanosensitive channel n=1 Tax=Paucimonas lemoignei TaxID=29443 RepID=A0A4R3HPW4_PAULE|nr:mechanosensitive ion channel family protein [Paucimonas lemoignei]TCS33785.1 small-conductance mechanosensitive channel [Paucimonas lemoignei]